MTDRFEFRVQLSVRAEQIDGPEADWEEVAGHLKAMLNQREIQIGNLEPKRFRVTSEIDTAEEVEA
jgi:hypothetical protein